MSNLENEQPKIPETVNRAIKMIGDDHILCIIGNLKDGGMRFNEIQRVTKVNPATLTARLSKLEKDGILSREEETLDKMSVVYQLTEKGKALLPIFNEITKFAERYCR